MQKQCVEINFYVENKQHGTIDWLTDGMIATPAAGQIIALASG